MRAISCQMCGASSFTCEHGLYVCEYCDTKYVFDGKERFVVSKSEGKLTVVSVRFNRSYKKYDYIYGLQESVHQGDTLVVNGFNGETEVTVVEVKQLYIEELPMPFIAYKYVVRKAERNASVLYD